jgi:hypothetical protein
MFNATPLADSIEEKQIVWLYNYYSFQIDMDAMNISRYIEFHPINLLWYDIIIIIDFCQFQITLL